ncbi:hypothetical protein [Thermobaculum terrenum]|nr:hypothetical protein [Thermobaculum terrenum]
MSMEDVNQNAQQITGVSNVAYDLMSVLQNFLEAMSAIEVYKEDAEEANDQELLELFNRIQSDLGSYVEDLKPLLVSRLQS